MSNTHVALEAASSLHKNTPVNILSADGSANNQMTIRAPGFSVLWSPWFMLTSLKFSVPPLLSCRVPFTLKWPSLFTYSFFPFRILMSGLGVEWPRHKSSRCWPHPVRCPPATGPLSPPVPYTCSRHMLPLRGLSAWPFPFNKCLAWNRREGKHEESSGVVVPRGKGGNAAKGIPLLPRPPSFLLLTFATIRLQIASCLHASPG